MITIETYSNSFTTISLEATLEGYTVKWNGGQAAFLDLEEARSYWNLRVQVVMLEEIRDLGYEYRFLLRQEQELLQQKVKDHQTKVAAFIERKVRWEYLSSNIKYHMERQFRYARLAFDAELHPFQWGKVARYRELERYHKEQKEFFQSFR